MLQFVGFVGFVGVHTVVTKCGCTDNLWYSFFVFVLTDGMEVDPNSAVAGQFDDADVDHW